MAVLPVRTFPDSVLKTPARTVDSIAPHITKLVDDLIDTMRHHPRCVGLAAPQVGAGVRVAVVDVGSHPKTGSSASGLLVCINPKIIEQDGALVQREGCQSVPDLTGNVRRATRVRVTALDAKGREWTKWCEGFEAIAIQHEVDHLAGTLFLDRIANIRTDVFRRKRYWFPGEGEGKPSAR